MIGRRLVNGGSDEVDWAEASKLWKSRHLRQGKEGVGSDSLNYGGAIIAVCANLTGKFPAPSKLSSNTTARKSPPQGPSFGTAIMRACSNVKC